MSFFFYSIRLSVVIALAAGSFFGVHAYVAAEAAPVTVSKPDQIAEELARAAFTGTLSPILKVAEKHTKVARARTIQVPMQIAYIPDRRIVR